MSSTVIYARADVIGMTSAFSPRMTQIRDQIRDIVREEIASGVTAVISSFENQIRNIVIDELSRQLGEADVASRVPQAFQGPSDDFASPAQPVTRRGRPMSMTKEAVYQRERRAEKKKQAEARKAQNSQTTESVGAAVAEAVAQAMKIEPEPSDPASSTPVSGENGHATGVATTISFLEEPDLGLSV